MTRRWRPSLWFVLGGAMGGTLGLSLIGLVIFRYLGPVIGFGEAAILLGAAIGILTGALWLILVRLLQRPVTGLAAYAAAVRAAPDAATPEPAHFGTRELHRMAVNVIDMAGTLADREATIRSFTDHVTHELKTPVTAIRAATELLEDDPALSPGNRALVGQIAGAGEQMQRQLAALRELAAAREVPLGGGGRLADLLPSLGADHPGLQVTAGGAERPLPLSPDVLGIVLRHMADNAAAHGARALRLTADAEGLTIADDGKGISPGNRAHVFEPFFTTRRESGGTGMGLYIVARLLKAQGAEIAIAPTPSGTTFRITFPG
ncbi:signal transduction histidine kinase [Defluviimonas denitrificans]|uniref:histidine kinase n=1 Tax=Albidovulum denitrificans TaxID=404881 RepID=A0A2S8SDY3_9RHOB|nr:HAMP domain-containing sensor histidine kinase [Defluviimonas denitrificans]PQV59003.1 signal transduction histidine kinase [Defluviimonas denitrificans]